MKTTLAFEDIVEFTDHAPDALRRLRDSGRALVLTAGGAPAAVVITPEEYERLHQQDRLLAAIDRGLADSEAGRVVDHDELKRELEAEFGPLDERDGA